MPGATSKAVSTSAELTTAGNRILVFAISILHGDTAQSSVTLKDGGTSGTARWALSSVAGTASGDKTDSISFGDHPLEFKSGCWVALTGTDTAVYIAYKDLGS